MLAKGLGGVNGKCVPLCTMMEMNCRKFALSGVSHPTNKARNFL
jgi:hypothetical protein